MSGPEDWRTTSPVNMSGMSAKDQKRFHEEQIAWMRLPHAMGQTCVEWAKSALGRQKYCWVGGSENRRFYVWEDEERTWRLFVHNDQGLTFEVSVDLEHDEVIGVWDSFKKRAGALR